jgi:choline dehydrogenase
MLSGVGPAKQLAAHSIPLVHDLSGVGGHLMDHVAVELRYRNKTEDGLNFVPRSFGQRLGFLWATWKWRIFGTGLLTSNVRIYLSFYFPCLMITTLGRGGSGLRTID